MLRFMSAFLTFFLLFCGNSFLDLDQSRSREEDEPVSAVEKSKPEVREVTLSFLGDLMISTMPGRYGGDDFLRCVSLHEPDYFLEGIAPLLENDFCTFGNLETVLSDRALSRIEKGYGPAYWYKSPASVASILTAGGLDVLSLSNNHTGDYGQQGLEDTKRALEAEGLLWGDGSTTVHLYPDGAHIAVYCCLFSSVDDGEDALRWLRQMRTQSDLQIIYYHGGDFGDPHCASETMLRTCRLLVDEGADLVVGHHPHVLQQIEWYHGVLIAPSLGAVIFGDGRPENAGAVLQVKICVEVDATGSVPVRNSSVGENSPGENSPGESSSEGNVWVKQADFYPFRLWENYDNRWHPTLLMGAEAERVRYFLWGLSDSPVS